MTRNVDLSKLTPIDEMAEEDEEETSQLRTLHAQARNYLSSFKWVKKIEAERFGLGIADIVGVFFFEIAPAEPNVDHDLWVVVGDLPSAYLVTDQAPNPARALRAYIDEMDKWVNAAASNKSVAGLIPVNVPANRKTPISSSDDSAFSSARCCATTPTNCGFVTNKDQRTCVRMSGVIGGEQIKR